MKNSLFLTFLILITIKAQTQSNDPIKNYQGIPLITYSYGIDDIHRNHFDSIKQAGIFATEATNLTSDLFIDKLQGTGLFLVPEQVGESNAYKNAIIKYTEARYTEWEAEGTPPEDGELSLIRDTIYSYVESGAVKTKENIPNGWKVISGPHYAQEKFYYMVNANSIIKYRAKFRLKLESRIPHLNNLLPDTSVICKIKVTSQHSYPAYFDTINNKWVWQFCQPINLAEKKLKFSDFKDDSGLIGEWKAIILNYDLQLVPNYSRWSCDTLPTSQQAYNSYFSSTNYWGFRGANNPSEQYLGRRNAEGIEFTVEYSGYADKVQLSVDKIIVYDERAEYFENNFAKNEISAQLQENGSRFGNMVAGWLAVDEPWCYDQWGAIRKVNEIIEEQLNSDIKLWIQFNQGWNATLADPHHPSASSKIYTIDEFIKRVKKANVWALFYYFDYPYSKLTLPDNYFRVNLELVTKQYDLLLKASKRTNEALYPGISIQTGKYLDTVSYGGNSRFSREIFGYELIYEVNLALLYGAKVISPWLYFGYQNNYQDYTGFVNKESGGNFTYTTKYDTLKNIIAPRLNNLMGKTLKRIKATNQYPEINLGNVNKEFIQMIDEVIPSNNNRLKELDLGFF